MSSHQSLSCWSFYSNTCSDEKKASEIFEYTDNVGGRYIDLDYKIWPCIILDVAIDILPKQWLLWEFLKTLIPFLIKNQGVYLLLNRKLFFPLIYS